MGSNGRLKVKDRKMATMIMLSENEITFLDKKVRKSNVNLRSRSAIIRFLINTAMEHPDILDKA